MRWVVAATPRPHAVRIEAGQKHLDRQPTDLAARLQLAWLLHELARWDDALDVLAPAREPAAERMRGMVLLTAGRDAEALVALERAVALGADAASLPLVIAIARTRGPEAARPFCLRLLEHNPDHAQALGVLTRQLLEAGDAPALAALCDQLRGRGADNAQLDASWAAAQARLGERPDLVTPWQGRLGRSADARDRLTREILHHPNQVTPRRHVAMRGGSRINHPLVTGAPEFAALAELIRHTIDEYDGPVERARRREVRLDVWAIILGGDDHEGWHLHPAGVISGVYYVTLPAAEPGALEFGLLPGDTSAWSHRIEPVEDGIVLFPSSHLHRTVPTGATELRISVAFDVVPA